MDSSVVLIECNAAYGANDSRNSLGLLSQDLGFPVC